MRDYFWGPPEIPEANAEAAKAATSATGGTSLAPEVARVATDVYGCSGDELARIPKEQMYLLGALTKDRPPA